MARLRILYVEPFDTGSHAQFTRAITAGVAADWTVLTAPGRHWKWRMRGAGLWFAAHARDALARRHDLVFASSFTPLADLVALAPALATVPKVLYFHENQWEYPVRFAHERDHHFGVTQLVAAAVADLCLFNSQWNRDSFLRGCRQFLARMPDCVPAGTVDAIARRSEVLPLPVVECGAVAGDVPPGPARAEGPRVLWNHRWEHDKGPDAFVTVFERLAAEGVPFRLLLAGESYREVPAALRRAQQTLATRIAHCGFVADAAEYARLCASAQLAVSTAEHEFFGIAMLDAAAHGATVLVPDRLAYPELFPAPARYADLDDLATRIARLCSAWTAASPGDRGADLRTGSTAWLRPVDRQRVLAALAARLEALHADRHSATNRS